MKIVEIVRDSWNKMGEEYYHFRDKNKMNSELEKFSKLLPEKAHILDAGTGAGIPVAKFFVEKGFQVTGVDISEKMIELAKKNVPKAEFHRKDILKLDFPDNSFEAIICVYTLWHIPKEEHQNIFTNFQRMLKPNGLLLINTGTRESDGIAPFFGNPMLWSNKAPQETLEVI